MQKQCIQCFGLNGRTTIFGVIVMMMRKMVVWNTYVDEVQPQKLVQINGQSKLLVKDQNLLPEEHLLAVLKVA